MIEKYKTLYTICWYAAGACGILAVFFGALANNYYKDKIEEEKERIKPKESIPKTVMVDSSIHVGGGQPVISQEPKPSKHSRSEVPPKISNETNVNTSENKGNIGGNGNSVDNSKYEVNGDNYGINGPVTIGTVKKELQSGDHYEMITRINKIFSEHPDAKRSFTILIAQGSNGGYLARDISNFLVKNMGLTKDGDGIMISDHNGILIGYNKLSSNIHISIGNID